MTANRTLVLIWLAGLTTNAGACAVCAGGDNQQLIAASNSVIWALLGLVAFIMVATAGTVFFLWKKATTPLPPHLQLIATISPADAED